MKIWSWIVGVLAVIAGIFGVGWKRSAEKNQKLQREIKVKDKQTEIRREQDATVDKVKRTEADRIEQHTKPDGRSRADRINSVLNDRNNP